VAEIYTVSQKKQTPTIFWQGFIKKAQMLAIFDIDSCTSSVHLQLQVTSLLLLRTTYSFHGNDSSVVWLLWADFEKAMEKQLQACVKGKGEHFEHLL